VIPFGDSILAIFELIGIFVFATSGALMAIRKDFDAVGIVLLAEITAIGGGSYATSSSGRLHQRRSQIWVTSWCRSWRPLLPSSRTRRSSA
jgi:hypothetical protein